jgi:hypothetical protein
MLLVVCTGAVQNFLDARPGNGQRYLEEELTKTLMQTKKSSGQASSIDIRSIKHETRGILSRLRK